MNFELKSISAADLEQFPNLVFLEVSGSPLTSLDGDLFKYNPNMRYIYLYQNQIQHVGLDLVKNLNNLQALYMHGNPCTHEDTYTFDRKGTLKLNDELPLMCPPLGLTTTTKVLTKKTRCYFKHWSIFFSSKELCRFFFIEIKLCTFWQSNFTNRSISTFLDFSNELMLEIKYYLSKL